MKDFSIDIIRNAVEKSFIKAEYNENIIYRWLKRPCLLFKQKQNILSQESLFYICFQLLDYLKQYEYLDDPQLQTEIQCIPYEIEHLLNESDYSPLDGEYYCTVDRLLVIITLYTLLRLLGGQETDILAQYLLIDMNYKMPGNFVAQENKVYSTLQNGIQAALTNDSPIYKHSTDIMHHPEYYSETDKMHLIEFVQTYFDSDRLISHEIAAHLAKDTHVEAPLILPAHDYQAETEQLQKQIAELQTALQKKDEEIIALQAKQQAPVPDNSAVLLNENKQLKQELEELQEQKQQLLQNLQSYAHPVHIVKGKKSKAATIFSAMFYANYFQCDNNLNKNECVAAILQRIFNDSSNSIPQLVSSYLDKGTLDQLKQELIDTLSDLQHAKNTDRTLR